MPVIKLDYLNTKIEDTYVNSGNPNANYDAQPAIIVGANYEQYIKFDLGLIPNNAIINSATLTLTKQTSGIATIDIKKILTNVNFSAVAWNTKPTHSNTVTSVTTPNTSATKFDIDLKTIVQDWVNGSLGNNGISLISTGSAIQFYSIEYSVGADRPYITIDYTIPTMDKKQVEFIGEKSTVYASIAAGTTMHPEVPNGIRSGDMLVAYVTNSLSTMIRTPPGWQLLFNEPYYLDVQGVAVFYKIADGTETTMPLSYGMTTGGESYVVLSIHAYRNVLNIKQYGVMTKTYSTIVGPSAPISVPSNHLLIPVVGILTNTTPTTKLNFSRLSSGLHTNRALHVYSTYNYGKTEYSISDLSFTLTTAYTGMKVISLEPVVNEAPRIDGKDEHLGTFTAPFTKSYNVTDTEGDAITVKEKLNGNVIATKTGAGTHTINIAAQWDSLPLGKHTITLEANDNYNNPPHEPRVRTWTFTKTLPDTAKTPAILSGIGDVLAKMEAIKQLAVSKLKGDPLDRLEDILNKFVLGPKKATGSGTTNGNAQLFITGLDFQPRMVSVKGPTYYYVVDFEHGQSTARVGYGQSYTSTQTANGCTITIGEANSPVTWKAYE